MEVKPDSFVCFSCWQKTEHLLQDMKMESKPSCAKKHIFIRRGAECRKPTFWITCWPLNFCFNGILTLFNLLQDLNNSSKPWETTVSPPVQTLAEVHHLGNMLNWKADTVLWTRSRESWCIRDTSVERLLSETGLSLRDTNADPRGEGGEPEAGINCQQGWAWQRERLSAPQIAGSLSKVDGTRNIFKNRHIPANVQAGSCLFLILYKVSQHASGALYMNGECY